MNHYRLNDQQRYVVNVSGGRSSAMMLYRIVDHQSASRNGEDHPMQQGAMPCLCTD